MLKSSRNPVSWKLVQVILFANQVVKYLTAFATSNVPLLAKPGTRCMFCYVYICFPELPSAASHPRDVFCRCWTRGWSLSNRYRGSETRKVHTPKNHQGPTEVASFSLTTRKTSWPRCRRLGQPNTRCRSLHLYHRRRTCHTLSWSSRSRRFRRSALDPLHGWWLAKSSNYCDRWQDDARRPPKRSFWFSRQADQQVIW